MARYRTKYMIELVIEHTDGEADVAIEHVLDAGTLQDAVIEHAADQGYELTIMSCTLVGDEATRRAQGLKGPDFVIICDGRFLVTPKSGNRWSNEYPDAFVFRSEGEARRVRTALVAMGKIAAGAAEIVGNYGLTTEVRS